MYTKTIQKSLKVFGKTHGFTCLTTTRKTGASGFSISTEKYHAIRAFGASISVGSIRYAMAVVHSVS